MPGPAPKNMKHGRTPNASADWREVEDVPFAGAPELPKPPGRKRAWHPMAVAWWNTTSVMPHCKLWRAEDWQKVFEQLYEKDKYYSLPTDEQTTSQLTEMRRRDDALGIGDQARLALKIRYIEPADGADEVRGGDEVLHEQDDTGADPDAAQPKVTSLADRRRSITKAS